MVFRPGYGRAHGHQEAKLETELIASVKAPDVKARFDQTGFDVVGNTSAQFAGFLTAEIGHWKLVIETGKITAE